MNELEKAAVAADTFQAFVNQFGEPDSTLTILLEVLLEELFCNPSAALKDERKASNDSVSN